ncbi:hypothetical protein KRR38_23465 [Novosphingobium sp. G106]|uniref:hypothetical protein n=1 Tax=Novosphingobium sp. G106 TaxID=2849500 RepID=UPI001C2D65EA|nr:hypothetical protein [Novosphingobium sp. G106]MBV1690552.1 hypothetical protein [Novosphingobium sp. G106]
MSQPVSFYVEQAAKCGTAAAAAKLVNEREKFLAAQIAWQTLADAAMKTRDEAAKREAAKLAGALS